MNTAYIVSGELVDHVTIKLKEPIPLENCDIKVVVEPEQPGPSGKRIFGKLKGKITIDPSFYEPLDDFKDYM